MNRVQPIRCRASCPRGSEIYERDCVFPDCALEWFDNDAGHDPRNHFGSLAALQAIGLKRSPGSR